MKQEDTQKLEANGLEIMFYKYSSVEFDFTRKVCDAVYLEGRDSEGTWES